MRWRALQVGRIYIKQHPRDGRLSVQDLKDMVGQQGERFSKQVIGTSAYSLQEVQAEMLNCVRWYGRSRTN